MGKADDICFKEDHTLVHHSMGNWNDVVLFSYSGEMKHEPTPSAAGPFCSVEGIGIQGHPFTESHHQRDHHGHQFIQGTYRTLTGR